jgi:hypothetical protein
MTKAKVFCMALITIMVFLSLSCLSFAEDGEAFKWYGIGGELDDPNRWFGRIGITEDLGAEIVFGVEHRSDECSEESTSKDCDYTRLDVGAGFIYDFAPVSRVTPYVAGRFVLSMTGNGSSETSGTVEAASGVEYVILKRLGVSGELNFNFGTNPTKVMTTTRLRFYFYL